MLKVGDHVKSIKYPDLEGIIVEIGRCRKPGCRKDELTLDVPGKSVRTYWHTDTFVLVVSLQRRDQLTEWVSSHVGCRHEISWSEMISCDWARATERKEFTIKAELLEGGHLYVTREITNVTWPLTKWDLLSDYERKIYSETPFTANGTGLCSTCGEKLNTEADFAKHYIITDIRYLNLGYCSKKGPSL